MSPRRAATPAFLLIFTLLGLCISCTREAPPPTQAEQTTPPSQEVPSDSRPTESNDTDELTEASDVPPTESNDTDELTETSNDLSAPPTGGVQIKRLGAPGLLRSQGDPDKAARDRGEGPVDRASKKKRWLGISVANMKQPIAGAPPDARAMVTRAIRGSPAHTSGLQRGDCIVAANGKPVTRYQDYLDVARTLEIGDSISLDLLRDGQEITASVTMIERPKSLNSWRRDKFPGTKAFDFDLPSLRPASGNHKAGTGTNGDQLLYFWATWCGPCRRTSPQVDKFYKEAGAQTQVVAISSEDKKTLNAFLTRSDYTYPVAHDNRGELKLDYEINKLPTIVLIDSSGTVVSWDYGLGGVQRVLSRARDRLSP